jgi:hypothetical protein
MGHLRFFGFPRQIGGWRSWNVVRSARKKPKCCLTTRHTLSVHFVWVVICNCMDHVGHVVEISSLLSFSVTSCGRNSLEWVRKPMWYAWIVTGLCEESSPSSLYEVQGKLNTYTYTHNTWNTNEVPSPKMPSFSDNIFVPVFLLVGVAIIAFASLKRK